MCVGAVQIYFGRHLPFTGIGEVRSSRYTWNVETAGSNPAYPTQKLTKKLANLLIIYYICYSLIVKLRRFLLVAI